MLSDWKYCSVDLEIGAAAVKIILARSKPRAFDTCVIVDKYVGSKTGIFLITVIDVANCSD